MTASVLKSRIVTHTKTRDHTPLQSVRNIYPVINRCFYCSWSNGREATIWIKPNCRGFFSLQDENKFKLSFDISSVFVLTCVLFLVKIVIIKKRRHLTFIYSSAVIAPPTLMLSGAREVLVLTDDVGTDVATKNGNNMNQKF